MKFSFSRCRPITLLKENWKLDHFKLNSETLTLPLIVDERCLGYYQFALRQQFITKT